MLEAIRKRSAGIVVKSLLGLLILSFAMWGIADVFSPGGADQTVATVGDIEIQPDQVRREYQREIERLSSVLGTRLDSEQARMFGISQSVVKRMVERSLYDLAALDLGVLVNDNLVRRDIRDFAAFKNEKGEFERYRFQQLLQNNRLSEAGYVELTRKDIARAQFLSMVGSQALVPDRLARSLYVHRNEKRIAETVTFKYDSVTNINEPTDSELSEYHKANAQDYTAPEYRSLTFISLTAQEIASEIAVSDDAIAEAYEQRIDEFTEPGKRTFQQIRFKDETSARAAHDSLKTGGDFIQVAKELANMDAAATELGDMKKSELLPGLAEPAFALELDGYTEPLKTILGWHILRLKGIIQTRTKPLEEVSADLKKQIAADLAIDSLYDLANRVEDELGGGASLEEAARALNLLPRREANIAQSGINQAGSPVANLPGGNFLEVAFSTASGQESALTEAGEDGYFIVRVDNVTQAALRPLDSVRAGVVDSWKADQRRIVAQKNGDALIEKIKAGGNFAKLAADLGLTVTTREPVGRSGGEALPRELVSSLFDAVPGNTVAAAGNDGYIVAHLKQTIAADPLADRALLKTMSEGLNTAIRQDLMNQLANGLSQQFPVSINTEAINAQF